MLGHSISRTLFGTHLNIDAEYSTFCVETDYKLLSRLILFLILSSARPRMPIIFCEETDYKLLSSLILFLVLYSADMH